MVMEFICADCGRLLEIQGSLTIASSTTIKISPCEHCLDKQCIKEKCSKFMELSDQHTMIINQMQEDINNNDKIIANAKKALEGEE